MECCNDRTNVCLYTDYIKMNLVNGAITTLIGKKISNFVVFNKKHINSRDTFIHELEDCLVPFEVEYRILWENETSYYVFVYQSNLMLASITDKKNKAMLARCNYNIFSNDLDIYLDRMQNRFRSYRENDNAFPHEMGIFLGYPCDDVEAFIKNEGKNYLYCGYWKVYCNLEQAKQIFETYDSVKTEAMQMLSMGYPLESLCQLRNDLPILIQG